MVFSTITRNLPAQIHQPMKPLYESPLFAIAGSFKASDVNTGLGIKRLTGWQSGLIPIERSHGHQVARCEILPTVWTGR